MRNHSNHIVLTKEDAVAAALSASAFQPAEEVISVNDALGRVLAQDVYSLIEAPNMLTSRMDAVALRWDQIAAGIPDNTDSWQRGVEWDFANTGRALPDGYDTALRIEEVDITCDKDGIEHIKFIGDKPRCRGEGTQAPGSKLQVGDLLATANSVLTPLILASIAGGGHSEVTVVQRPKVGFIPTGNELVEPTNQPAPGKTIDTNTTLLINMIREWGGEPICHSIVPDDIEAIKAALYEMADACDIVVINAGSSKGSDDWTMEVLDEIGTVINHETNHAPSRHSAYALLEGTVVVGISGPARGAAFTSEFYLHPLINHYLGLTPEAPRAFARLVKPLPQNGRHYRNPGKLSPEKPKGQKSYFIHHMLLGAGSDGQLEAEPIPLGETLLVNQAGGYFALDCDSGTAMPQVGDLIEIQLRWPYCFSACRN